MKKTAAAIRNDYTYRQIQFRSSMFIHPGYILVSHRRFLSTSVLFLVFQIEWVDALTYRFWSCDFSKGLSRTVQGPEVLKALLPKTRVSFKKRHYLENLVISGTIFLGNWFWLDFRGFPSWWKLTEQQRLELPGYFHFFANFRGCSWKREIDTSKSRRSKFSLEKLCQGEATPEK